MIDRSRIKQLLLFSLLALVSYAVFDKYFNSDASQLYEPFTKGYALSGVTIQSTDETGQIITTIKSPAVTHYADTEKTIIQEPHIILHDADGDWLFNSEVGEINAQQTEIYFPSLVVIDLDGENKQAEAIQIVTSELTVDVTQKSGKTAAKLSISEAGSNMRGLGAEVNFKLQEIDILSELYAEFEN